MSEQSIDDNSTVDTPDEGSTDKDEKWGFRKNKYAFFVVMFILLIRMTN